MMVLPSKKERKMRDEVDEYLYFDLEVGDFRLREDAPERIKEMWKILQAPK